MVLRPSEARIAFGGVNEGLSDAAARVAGRMPGYDAGVRGAAPMSSERVKAFGREVRRRRLAPNMTLVTLGEAAGLGEAYIGEIEVGSRRPRAARVAWFQRALRCGPRGGPHRLNARDEAADRRARASSGRGTAEGKGVLSRKPTHPVDGYV